MLSPCPSDNSVDVGACHGTESDLFLFPLENDTPVRARGVKSRMSPPYPQRDRKRRLNGAVCPNHRFQKGGPVSLLGRARERTPRNV